ncbi:MAG TPA: crossover junction endodeoxyribonuclease RuvC [Patescibacteria group bacterium]|nr:crossover junction endodeoxyribonuclease RuvC [Patescibacteria group bacterium]
MLFLGIDPGYAIVGYGVVEKKQRNFIAREYGTITTSANTSIEIRLEKIHRDLKKLIKEIQPDVVAVEELFFYKNIKTAIDVGQARGVIVLTAQLSRTPIMEFTPLQVKQALTGYGRADKQQMQRMVQSLLKLKTLPQPDDAADALAIALCAAQSWRSKM